MTPDRVCRSRDGQPVGRCGHEDNGGSDEQEPPLMLGDSLLVKEGPAGVALGGDSIRGLGIVAARFRACQERLEDQEDKLRREEKPLNERQ